MTATEEQQPRLCAPRGCAPQQGPQGGHGREQAKALCSPGPWASTRAARQPRTRVSQGYALLGAMGLNTGCKAATDVSKPRLCTPRGREPQQGPQGPRTQASQGSALPGTMGLNRGPKATKDVSKPRLCAPRGRGPQQGQQGPQGPRMRASQGSVLPGAVGLNKGPKVTKDASNPRHVAAAAGASPNTPSSCGTRPARRVVSPLMNGGPESCSLSPRTRGPSS